MRIENYLKLNASTLQGSPSNGSIEYDGTNIYFTTGGIRTACSFGTSSATSTTPINTQIAYASNYNKIGISSRSYSGYTPTMGQGTSTPSGTVYAGTVSTSPNNNTFTITTNPNFTVNSFVNKYFLVSNSAESQILKVKANTANTVTFCENIIITGTITIRDINTNTGNWFLSENYIDTGYTGNQILDILYDGSYLWFITVDSGLIYKLNPSTLTISSIAHGLSNPKHLLYDGRYIWIINSLGNFLKINQELNASFNITNTLFSPLAVAVEDGVWVFGLATGVFTYRKYNYTSTSPVINNTFTSNNGLTAVRALKYNGNNKIYLFFNNSNNFTCQSFDTSSNTFSSNLINVNSGNVSFYTSAFDGNNYWIILRIGNDLTLNKFNPATETFTENVATATGFFNTSQLLGDLIWTGELLYLYHNDALNNYGKIYSIDVNNVSSSNLFSNASLAPYIDAATKLFNFKDNIIIWGRRYIIRDYLPKSERNHIFHSTEATSFGAGIKHKWKVINQDNYIIDTKDYGLLINSGTVFTIILPDPAKCQYQEFILKDNLGTANSNPIVITGTIDGSTTFSINTDYASITLVSNGTEWRVI